MKMTVDFSMFCDEFRRIRPNDFSYDGLRILFDYFEEYEQETDEEIELDVIAICSEFEQMTLDDYLIANNLVELDDNNEAKFIVEEMKYVRIDDWVSKMFYLDDYVTHNEFNNVVIRSRI